MNRALGSKPAKDFFFPVTGILTLCLGGTYLSLYPFYSKIY